MSTSTGARRLTHDRFGIFVHWGLYSGAARHEWVMTRERMTVEAYRPYFEHFDASRFDAEALADAVAEAGAGYAVLTTKHHEGFCLWDSDETDYCARENVGRDLVREYVDALRARGLGVGFYHSLIDWHHPDFTVDQNHPRRDDAGPDPQARAALNEGKDMARYRAYLHAQVRELLTRYGPIDYLFVDFTYDRVQDGWQGKTPEDWDAEGLLAMCRELQPGMVVNDRLGIPGDLTTPEQYQPVRTPVGPDGAPLFWEACQTTNGSWGYDRDNLDFKSPRLLVEMLVDSVSKGGNLLLNVGPDGRGALRPEDERILDEIGAWAEVHRDSYVGAGPAEFAPPREGVYTRRGDKLYLHLTQWPLGAVHLPGLADRVTYARFLHDGSFLETSAPDPDAFLDTVTPVAEAAGTLTVHLPVRRPDVLVPVVELTLR